MVYNYLLCSVSLGPHKALWENMKRKTGEQMGHPKPPFLTLSWAMGPRDATTARLPL